MLKSNGKRVIADGCDGVLMVFRAGRISAFGRTGAEADPGLGWN